MTIAAYFEQKRKSCVPSKKPRGAPSEKRNGSTGLIAKKLPKQEVSRSMSRSPAVKKRKEEEERP